MHQGIYMDAHDDNQCSWMSWVSIVMPWSTNTFLWMLKMTLNTAGCLSMLIMSSDAAGCHGCLSMLMMTLDAALCLDAQVVTRCTKGFIWMLKMTIDAAGCLGCLSMHMLCLDAPTHFYGCPRWPWMQLDAQDNPWCSWMSWMSINTQVLPWCTKGFIWMLKMTLDAAGCLGCLSMYKLCLVAPTHFYGCSRWPLMQLDAQDGPQCGFMYLGASWCTWLQLDVPRCILMYLLVAWCTWMQLDVLAWGWVEILGFDVPGWYLMLIW